MEISFNNIARIWICYLLRNMVVCWVIFLYYVYKCDFVCMHDHFSSESRCPLVTRASIIWIRTQALACILP